MHVVSAKTQSVMGTMKKKREISYVGRMGEYVAKKTNTNFLPGKGLLQD